MYVETVGPGVLGVTSSEVGVRCPIPLLHRWSQPRGTDWGLGDGTQTREGPRGSRVFAGRVVVRDTHPLFRHRVRGGVVPGLGSDRPGGPSEGLSVPTRYPVLRRLPSSEPLHLSVTLSETKVGLWSRGGGPCFPRLRSVRRRCFTHTMNGDAHTSLIVSRTPKGPEV